jgi:cytochrome c biogenesis protein ResB
MAKLVVLGISVSLCMLVGILAPGPYQSARAAMKSSGSHSVQNTTKEQHNPTLRVNADSKSQKDESNGRAAGRRNHTYGQIHGIGAWAI